MTLTIRIKQCEKVDVFKPNTPQRQKHRFMSYSPPYQVNNFWPHNTAFILVAEGLQNITLKTGIDTPASHVILRPLEDCVALTERPRSAYRYCETHYVRLFVNPSTMTFPKTCFYSLSFHVTFSQITYNPTFCQYINLNAAGATPYYASIFPYLFTGYKVQITRFIQSALRSTPVYSYIFFWEHFTTVIMCGERLIC